MTPQLSSSQLLHAEKVFQQKVDAKTLECAALRQLIDIAPALIVKAFIRTQDAESEMGVREALGNYLTAKLNQAVIELQEFELQLKAIQSMSNRIQPSRLF